VGFSLISPTTAVYGLSFLGFFSVILGVTVTAPFSGI